MPEQRGESIFNYWGKADDNYPAEPKWNLLAYHCLDVAAVAASWWDVSPALDELESVFPTCVGMNRTKPKSL